MVFHKDAPENEKLVSKRSRLLGLGRVMYLDVAQMLEHIKSCLRYGGARGAGIAQWLERRTRD